MDCLHAFILSAKLLDGMLQIPRLVLSVMIFVHHNWEGDESMDHIGKACAIAEEASAHMWSQPIPQAIS